MSKLVWSLLLLAVAAPVEADWQSPTLATRTLADRDFSVPADLPDGPTLLIIGFTQGSRAQTTAWSRALADDVQLKSTVATYQVAVIEDVPALMRGFVVRGIRKGVPEALHERFLLVTDKMDEWKTLASYSKPDAAYLILLDRQRSIRWRGAGDFSSLSAAALRVVAIELQNAP